MNISNCRLNYVEKKALWIKPEQGQSAISHFAEFELVNFNQNDAVLFDVKVDVEYSVCGLNIVISVLCHSIPLKASITSLSDCGCSSSAQSHEFTWVYWISGRRRGCFLSVSEEQEADSSFLDNLYGLMPWRCFVWPFWWVKALQRV